MGFTAISNLLIGSLKSMHNSDSHEPNRSNLFPEIWGERNGNLKLFRLKFASAMGSMKCGDPKLPGNLSNTWNIKLLPTFKLLHPQLHGYFDNKSNTSFYLRRSPFESCHKKRQRNNTLPEISNWTIF